MAEANKEAPEVTEGAGETPAPEAPQAPAKKSKRAPKEDPRGVLKSFGGYKLYVKG